MRKFAAFAVTGGLGFAADFAVLALATAYLGMNPYIARVLSVAVAMMLTWFLNRNYSFGASSAPVVVEGLRYGSVGLTASVVNFLIYGTLIALVPAMPPLLALVFASAAAMAFSWLGYSRFVFR